MIFGYLDPHINAMQINTAVNQAPFVVSDRRPYTV